MAVFDVVGHDRETGQATRLRVAATSANAARGRLEKLGVVVALVQPCVVQEGGAHVPTSSHSARSTAPSEDHLQRAATGRQRYRVCGADARTGQDVEVEVHAENPEGAAKAANRQGIFVSTVRLEACHALDDQRQEFERELGDGYANRVLREAALPRATPERADGPTKRPKRVFLWVCIACLVVAVFSTAAIVNWDWGPSGWSREPAPQPFTAPPQAPSLSSNARQTLGAGGSPAAGSEFTGDGIKLAFLKKQAPELWSGQTREKWRRAHPGARQSGGSSQGAWVEYEEGGELCSTRVTFTSDRIFYVSFDLGMRDLAAARRDLRSFDEALGPSETTTPPPSLSGMADAENIDFRRWRVPLEGRVIGVICSTWLVTDEVNDNGVWRKLKSHHYRVQIGDLETSQRVLP